MNKTVNISNVGHDTRSIQRIIFEKANFGAPPVEFALSGIEGWHPVQWTQHPRLAAVKFADGSVVYIDSPPAYAPIDPIAKGGDNEPWEPKSDSLWDSFDHQMANAERELRDSNLIQDLESELADRAVVDVVLTAGNASEQIRGVFSGVAREQVSGEVDLPEESVVEEVLDPEQIWDAELRNVHKDGFGRLHGFIKSDKTGRFADDSWVTTSAIKEDFGNDRFITNSGTIYKVVSWTDNPMIAKVANAIKAVESAQKKG